MNLHLHWKNIGQGPSIVLIHGFLENSSMWDFCIETFSAQFTVHTVELPGHGLSEKSIDQWTIRQCAEWIWEDLERQNISFPILIGHSLGGYVAAQMSDLRTKHVKGLILYHSTLRNDDEEKIKIRNRSVLAVRANKSLYCLTMIKGLFPAGETSKYSSEVERLTSDTNAMTENGIAHTIIAMRDRPSMMKLLKSELKIIYLIGDIDPILPLETMVLEYENGGDNVESMILEDVAHMSHIERPEDALKSFLQAINLCLL